MIWAWLAVVVGFFGTNAVWWWRVRGLQRQLDAPHRQPLPYRDPMTVTQQIQIYTRDLHHKEVYDEN